VNSTLEGIKSLKRLRFLIGPITDEQRLNLLRSSQVSFLPMEAIGERGQLDLSGARELEEVKFGYTQLFDGNVVIAKITPCFENGKGALIQNLLNGVGFGTTELHVLNPGPQLEGRFRYYVTSSQPFRSLGEAVMTGAAGQKRGPEEFVHNYRIYAPPLPQQRAIANYLDRETAKVDALVDAKEHLLGLLAEKRRALITRAVTRGLDPDIPMRDSGIPWLGKIPTHWEVTRLKFVAEVRGGLTLGKDYGKAELSEYFYLRVANVQDGYLDLSELLTVEVPESEAVSCFLRNGDVLMNEGGDSDKLGRGCVWHDEASPCLHQNHVFAVRPWKIQPEWLSAWTCSEVAKGYFESRAKQSTNLASISGTNIKELPVLLPSEPEQRTIVAHIQKETAKLDALKEAAERTIVLLKERRTALISEAVTGKIDLHQTATPLEEGA